MTAIQTNNLSGQFLGWQCRIRQHAVRKQEGVPPQGVRASVKLDGEFLSQINTVINKRDPEQIVQEFRFMIQKTVDSQKVLENALKYLCEYYYQYPAEFNDRITALFAVDSELVDKMLQATSCELGFFQGNQRYTLQAKAHLCNQNSDQYQATYWHNHLFNPNMPGVVSVVEFEVDWQTSTMEQT